MAYNYITLVNHILRKTEFNAVDETDSTQFMGVGVDPIVQRVKDWVNEVYVEICNSGYWRFLEAEGTISLVQDQVSYDLSSDCLPGRVITVRDVSNDRLLRRIDFKDVDAISYSGETTEYPLAYYFVANKMHVYPTPSSAATIKYRYYKTVPELVNAEDVPSVPEAWKWVIIHGVMVRVNEFLEDQSAKISHMKYVEGLTQMRAENRGDRQRKNSIKPY